MTEDQSPLPQVAADYPKVAYLTGQYPEVSLTFILREVEALREMGVDVLTCSIRETPVTQHPGPAEKHAAATTYYVIPDAKRPLRLVKAFVNALRRPRKFLSALALTFQTSPPGLRALIYQIFFFIEAVILARHLEENEVEHIHNHFVFGSATVAMLASEITGIPYSFTLHGPADLLEPYRWRLDEKTKRAVFVSTISHYASSQIMFFSDPKYWDKIKIVHCGVSPDKYLANAEDPLPDRIPDEIRLLFVGRLAPVKGLRVLLKALQSLVDEIPDLRLVLVGDGPDRQELEALAAPLEGKVTFTGYLSQADVARAMQSCDVFVLPSFAEGVPVVLMEAMASEKPVIATTVAGVAELVTDSVNGYLVEPGNADSLVKRIRELALNDELRASMGPSGRKKVQQDFDIRTETAKLASHFLQSYQSRPRGDK